MKVTIEIGSHDELRELYAEVRDFFLTRTTPDQLRRLRRDLAGPTERLSDAVESAGGGPSPPEGK